LLQGYRVLFNMKTVLRRLLDLVSQDSGSTVVLFAMTLPVLIYGGGVAVEYGHLRQVKGRLQAAADAAAIGAAGDLRLANANQQQVSGHAQSIVNASLSDLTPAPTVSITFPAQGLVQVSIGMDVPSVVASFLGRQASHVQVSAGARLSSHGPPTCVIVLDPNAGAAWSMTGGTITANGCAGYSNSTASSGISLSGQSSLVASFLCSVGGASGSGYNPYPLTDCPAYPDPLGVRSPPSITGCTQQNMQIGSQMTVRLFPGVYCGGLTISGGASVTLSPGTYVIKDGPLSVTGSNTTMQGTNVGFYLTGSNAVLNFGGLSNISLTAPNSGGMAGLLFWEDKAVPPLQTHSIQSNNARLLLGTIYLPQGILSISSNTPVADQSAYTVIVARRLSLSSKPNLVLNTGYSATDIPVPAGVGPTGRAMLQ
jgi:Flp pilus assembly protein TadG